MQCVKSDLQHTTDTVYKVCTFETTSLCSYHHSDWCQVFLFLCIKPLATATVQVKIFRRKLGCSDSSEHIRVLACGGMRGMVERICHVIPCERRRNGLRFPQVESHWESGVFVTSGGPTIVFVRATIQWKFASASPEKHSTARVLSVIEDQIIGRFAPCVCCSSTGRMLQIVMAAFMDWSLRDLLSTWRAIMAWSFPPHRTRTMIRASGTPFPEFYILFNTNGLDSRWKEPTGRLNERNYRYCVLLLVLLLLELCM